MIKHLVIVMPAYNEASGLPGFISEIREHVDALAERVSIVVADDQSTDNTVEVLQGLGEDVVRVVPQPVNRGHGPTALAAYRAGLELEPEVLLHVDGDGQFLGEDFVRVLEQLTPVTDVVHGVRMQRTDPWFRKVITAGVRFVVRSATGHRVADVNTPMRAYRPAVARLLVDAVGPDAEVPHVHFSLAEARWGLGQTDVLVTSIPRRGGNETGTMWGVVKAPKLPPKRLRQFVGRAWKEVWRMSLRPGAPLRRKPAVGEITSGS